MHTALGFLSCIRPELFKEGRPYEPWQNRRARAEKDFVDWSTVTGWREWLPIEAATYDVLNLFPEVKPHKLCRTRELPVRCRALSPNGKFLYRNTILPARQPIGLFKKNGQRDCKHGYACFDGPVILPSLFEATEGGGWDTWKKSSPWMSLSPNETLTLRPGTARAKGHTIVAGLGLGHQLIQVCKRKQVTKVTLVERSQELIEWLWPRIRTHCYQPVRIICADAYRVLPKLRADVCLMDIFTDYGWNRERVERSGVMKAAAGIKSWWIWG